METQTKFLGFLVESKSGKSKFLEGNAIALFHKFYQVLTQWFHLNIFGYIDQFIGGLKDLYGTDTTFAIFKVVARKFSRV